MKVGRNGQALGACSGYDQPTVRLTPCIRLQVGESVDQSGFQDRSLNWRCGCESGRPRSSPVPGVLGMNEISKGK